MTAQRLPTILRDPAGDVPQDDSLRSLKRWLDCHLKGRHTRARLVAQSIGYAPSGSAQIYSWYRKSDVPVSKRDQVKTICDELYAQYGKYAWGNIGRKGREHAWKSKAAFYEDPS